MYTSAALRVLPFGERMTVSRGEWRVVLRRVLRVTSVTAITALGSARCCVAVCAVRESKSTVNVRHAPFRPSGDAAGHANEPSSAFNAASMAGRWLS